MNILVIEDERRLADAICHIIRSDGYNADAAYDGIDGLERARSGDYDAAVVDVMLPGIDGFEIVRRLRHDGSTLPVMMLTARTATSDKVTGLDIGADDYLTKPFESDELIARVRALTRRRGEVEVDETSVGDVVVDMGSREMTCAGTGKSVTLSQREFDVLRMLIRAKDRPVPKQALLNRVWGCDSDVRENSVEAYMSFLRKKLRHIGSSVGIETIRSLGYRLTAQG